jgi:hypothetical protein
MHPQMDASIITIIATGLIMQVAGIYRYSRQTLQWIKHLTC